MPVMSAAAAAAGHGSASTASASGVGRKVTVIPAAASHAASSAGEERTASPGIARLAPAASTGHTSQTAASKPGPATSALRSAGVSP